MGPSTTADMIDSVIKELRWLDVTNPRVKAIVITKLQEAYLFAREMHNDSF